jgi:hypothetical protein
MADNPPGECPDCGRAPIARIVYGEIKLSDEMADKIKRGEMVLGGCFVLEDAPTWRCTACGKEG